MCAVSLICGAKANALEVVVPDDVEKLNEAFGKAIIARDHEALDVLLAPWISVAAALDKVKEAVDETCREWEIDEALWPTEFESSSGSLSYDDLRAPSDFAPGVDIPAQVTADNYEGWQVITAFPPEGEVEFDAYFDAWFAVVRLADGLHVGSLEIVDPD
jgi:hypothetical protein